MIDNLYYKGESCSCCGGVTNAAHGIKISPKILEEFVRKVYRGYDVSREIEPTMWRAVLEQINEATVEGLAKSDAEVRDKRFLRALRHSNEVFTAFKVHSMGVKMAERLYDSKGRLRSFAEFSKAVRPIASHQVGAWLRTEYNTAVRRAHLAADWQEYEANKDLFPNLRWMPTTSPNAESSHQLYWEKKLTLPVDDPFWHKHHPGDRWNCKCSLEPTDAPATQGWSEEQGTMPQRGLDVNPKEGQLFADSHPYFPAKCSQCWAYKQAKGVKNTLERVFINRAKDCYNCPFIEGCVDRMRTIKVVNRERSKQIREEAQPLKEKIFFNKEVTFGMKISGAGIKEWLNQPHEHYREKNEALLELEALIQEAKYLGKTIDHKHKGVAYSHIFEVNINRYKSFIIVNQMVWDEYLVHSISDSKKFIELAQK